MRHFLRVVGHWGLLLHIYISMAGFTLVLLFAVTGLTLNHEDFGWGEPRITKATIALPADVVDHPDQTTLVQRLRDMLGVHSPVTDYHEDPDQVQVTFAAPGHRTVVTVDRAQRTGDVESALTGMVTLVSFRARRRSGFIVAALGVVSIVAAYWICVPQ